MSVAIPTGIQAPQLLASLLAAGAALLLFFGTVAWRRASAVEQRLRSYVPGGRGSLLSADIADAEPRLPHAETPVRLAGKRWRRRAAQAATRLFRRRVLAQLEQQLPSATDLMAASLRAGSTLAQAADAICREMGGPLAKEFRLIRRDMDLGMSFASALENVAERVPSADVQLLSSAVSMQHKVGGDLSPVLASLSHTIRERQRLRGEISVLTAQARYSAYIVAALPIGIFVLLWLTNYDYLATLFLPGVTRLLLAVAIAGEVIGFLLMRKLGTVKV